MKKALLIPVFLWIALCLQAQLPKQRLFKVDPASGIFKEMRVTVENRWKGDLFWFISPNFHHQLTFKRGFPERYFGFGMRGGLRYYLFGPESPHGFVISGHAGYHHDWVRYYDQLINVSERAHLHRMGVGFTAGYQWLYGAKKNIAFGFLLGLEYYFWLPNRKNADPDDYVRNWYDVIDLGSSRLRPYIGAEIGFAFRQKHRHW